MTDTPGEQQTRTPPSASPQGEKSAPHIHRVLAVMNPVSGLHRHERTAQELRDRARKLGVELDVVLTRADLDGASAVRSMTGPYDCYLAVGGDGTVMEVAGVAMEDGVPLAVLPRGTANAVAWHFRIPYDAGQALKVAVRGNPLRIDVAHTPDRAFLIAAGFGYDAAIIEGATRELKRRLGFLAYLYAAVKNFRRKPHVFRVELDDGRSFRVSGLSAVITNTGTLAGNLRFVKRISPQDGLIDLVIVSPESFRSFFRMLFLGMLGRLHEDPRVRFFQARRIRVQTRPSSPLEIDGDSVGTRREVTAEVLPGALSLMVLPEGMSWFPWVPDGLFSGDAFSWTKGKGKAKRGAEPGTKAEVS